MPPLPPSSAGGAVVVVLGVVVGVVVVSVDSVVVGSVEVESVVVVVGSVLSVVSVVDSDDVVELLSLLSLPPAITTTAITRPTITATRQAIRGACCRAACGRRGVRLAHQSCRVLVHGSVLRSEYRVEDLAGVLDLEAVSQPRLDFLPAAARDRHLGREQAGRG